MKTLKKTVIFIAVIAIAVSLPVSALSDMTPYNSLREDGYFNGATYILPTDSKDIASDVTTDLERMKDEYGINTISVYDLENLDKSENNENKDHLFSELKRLDMKIVVRIENYQASSFKFDESDLDYIMNYYDSIIRYVCLLYTSYKMRYKGVDKSLLTGQQRYKPKRIEKSEL